MYFSWFYDDEEEKEREYVKQKCSADDTCDLKTAKNNTFFAHQN